MTTASTAPPICAICKHATHYGTCAAWDTLVPLYGEPRRKRCRCKGRQP